MVRVTGPAQVRRVALPDASPNRRRSGAQPLPWGTAVDSGAARTTRAGARVLREPVRSRCAPLRLNPCSV